MNLPVIIDTATHVDGFIVGMTSCDGMTEATLEDMEGQPVRCQLRDGVQAAIALLDWSMPVRVHGLGRWRREHDGRWQLELVRVAGWAAVDEAAPDEVLAVLMSPENGWAKLPNPQEEWRE
ncbi:hypothetical protein PO883_08985 [Massilia sp. DJPM01]|uniref:hypothetical protein n=1 Tax=Massilia sp. DJPM01 TaxID=3024404 RepID=UPI00259FBEF3|nr:hypothetical protein [Massilia sp. DJPM01]MDM5177327.1 hypothetical protein [Massilia sp. DJPM01]